MNVENWSLIRMVLVLYCFDSNHWSSRAPDFRPWECVQDSASLWSKVLTDRWQVATAKSLPTIIPKILNHDKCLLHIQDATGKKKLAPGRSGKVTVSPLKRFKKHWLSYFNIWNGQVFLPITIYVIHHYRLLEKSLQRTTESETVIYQTIWSFGAILLTYLWIE